MSDFLVLKKSCGVLAKKVGHAKVRLEGPVNYLFSYLNIEY